MPSFFSFLISKRFPSRTILRDFFVNPHGSLGILLWGLVSLFFVLLYILAITLNNRLLITIPASGGTITEGIIGAPHTLNPLFAKTDTDIALVDLLYAGLTKKTADGNIVLELAKSSTVSPDGKTYTFILNQDLVWSDGMPLTSADIAFTVAKLQESAFSSPFTSYWQNISIDTPSATAVTFMLPEPDTSFLSKATFSIIPEHIWKDVPIEQYESDSRSMNPVGAGAFVVKKISYTNDIPHQIVLTRNKQYVLGAPLLQSLILTVFSNQQSLATAIQDSAIDSTFALEPAALSTLQLPKGYTTSSIPTKRAFTIYRLRNEPMLAHEGFVTILNQYLDKNKIIATVENGYGIPLSSNTPALSTTDAIAALKKLGYNLTNDVLYKNNNLVGISIATENTSPLLGIAHATAEQLENLGILVSVKAFDPGIFREQVRKDGYSVILGEARQLQSDTYQPALDLYTEKQVLVSRSTTGIPPYTLLTEATARYDTVLNWYTRTDRVWKWFTTK